MYLLTTLENVLCFFFKNSVSSFLLPAIPTGIPVRKIGNSRNKSVTLSDQAYLKLFGGKKT